MAVKIPFEMTHIIPIVVDCSAVHLCIVVHFVRLSLSLSHSERNELHTALQHPDDGNRGKKTILMKWSEWVANTPRWFLPASNRLFSRSFGIQFNEWTTINRNYPRTYACLAAHFSQFRWCEVWGDSHYKRCSTIFPLIFSLSTNSTCHFASRREHIAATWMQCFVDLFLFSLNTFEYFISNRVSDESASKWIWFYSSIRKCVDKQNDERMMHLNRV